jgi:hypothetical protein
MDTILAKFGEYDLVGLSLAALFFIVWKWQVWLMKFITETRNAHNEERRIWHELDISKARVLDSVVDSLKRHDEKAEERGRCVMKEHEKMIEVLDRINGFKDSYK